MTKLEARAKEMIEHAMGESWAQKKPLEELLAAAMVQLAREFAIGALLVHHKGVTVAEALRAAEEQQ
jgi:hypothetical protein